MKDDRDLSSRIAQMAPGKTVKVTYWRDGTSHDTDLTLGTYPTDDQLAAAGKVAPSPRTARERLALGLRADRAASDDDSGVAVTDVDPNGQAAEAGIQPGDVILRVGNTDVKTPSDVQKQVADAKAAGLKAVRLMVKSGDQTQFVALTFAAS